MIAPSGPTTFTLVAPFQTSSASASRKLAAEETAGPSTVPGSTASPALVSDSSRSARRGLSYSMILFTLLITAVALAAILWRLTPRATRLG